MTANQFLQLCISTLLMSVTILISARLILKVRGFPVGGALIIALISNALGKVFVSFAHLPSALSYSLPTLAFLVLSFLFFRPRLPRLLIYWLFGFAIYLAIHVSLSVLLHWDFMFPFWKIRSS
jgi:hypothetical protein